MIMNKILRAITRIIKSIAKFIDKKIVLPITKFINLFLDNNSPPL